MTAIVSKSEQTNKIQRNIQIVIKSKIQDRDEEKNEISLSPWQV